MKARVPWSWVRPAGSCSWPRVGTGVDGEGGEVDAVDTACYEEEDDLLVDYLSSAYGKVWCGSYQCDKK